MLPQEPAWIHRSGLPCGFLWGVTAATQPSWLRRVQSWTRPWLKQADMAMYQSKAAGRNTMRFFDPDMQALVAKSYQLGESDLPTRMRADNEKLDADLSLARARIELQRAISQLNQSFGTLP